MQDSYTRSSSRRVVSAFILAPLATAFSIACVFPIIDWFGHRSDPIQATFTFAIFTYPIATLLGIPAFIIVRKILKISCFNYSAVGAIIASFSVLSLGLLLRPGTSSIYEYCTATFYNGEMTRFGWLYLILNSAEAAIFGAFGGVVFWVIAEPRSNGSSRDLGVPVLSSSLLLLAAYVVYYTTGLSDSTGPSLSLPSSCSAY